MRQKTKQGQREITNVLVAGVTILKWVKSCTSKKDGHQDEAYNKKRLGEIEKGCKWRIGVTMNKIETSNPKISLIYFIDTPPNTASNNIPEIAD